MYLLRAWQFFYELFTVWLYEIMCNFFRISTFHFELDPRHILTWYMWRYKCYVERKDVIKSYAIILNRFRYRRYRGYFTIVRSYRVSFHNCDLNVACHCDTTWHLNYTTRKIVCCRGSRYSGKQDICILCCCSLTATNSISRHDFRGSWRGESEERDMALTLKALLTYSSDTDGKNRISQHNNSIWYRNVTQNAFHPSRPQRYQSESLLRSFFTSGTE